MAVRLGRRAAHYGTKRPRREALRATGLSRGGRSGASGSDIPCGPRRALRSHAGRVNCLGEKARCSTEINSRNLWIQITCFQTSEIVYLVTIHAGLADRRKVGRQPPGDVRFVCPRPRRLAMRPFGAVLSPPCSAPKTGPHGAAWGRRGPQGAAGAGGAGGSTDAFTRQTRPCSGP